MREGPRAGAATLPANAAVPRTRWTTYTRRGKRETERNDETNDGGKESEEEKRGGETEVSRRRRRDVYPLDCGLVRESPWEVAILFLLRRYPLPAANPMSCHPFA